MAKQTIPGVKASGGLLPKVIGAAVVLALLVLVVKHPTDAAKGTKTAFDLFGGLVDGLAGFFQALLG